MNAPVIVWLRNDLRMADNPALQHAVMTGAPVIPVFILSETEEGGWPLGGASRWWLHHSLKNLSAQFAERKMSLVLRSGAALDVLEQLIDETGATGVFWNRRYEPAIIDRDAKIKKELTDKDVLTLSFNGSLLFEPWHIKTGEGRPYQVFTPFWNTCTSLPEPLAPTSTPKSIVAYPKKLESDNLESWKLLPIIPWDKDFYAAWTPGEEGAQRALKKFLRPMIDYDEGRNFPHRVGTSRLSPYLHFGEISARQIWHTVRHHSQKEKNPTLFKNAQVYLKEIGWREFAHHLLYHFPHTPEKPLRAAFEKFPWEKDAAGLRAWQKGMTGYPIVDAGMRELWTTGWMHNRVRMIVASFLVKDLRISWTEGARWFWDTLVDANLANNTLGWQWSAGCGADAAPYFRIFNPTSQGEKFDPDGDYVKKWIPELKKIPSKWIHKPWSMPPEVVALSGVKIGRDYPPPNVDHAQARDRALSSFKKTKV